MELNKNRLGYYHELLDRLSCLCDIFTTMVIDHDSDDILSNKEKNDIIGSLAGAYQLVGSRMYSVGETENDISN